MRSTHLLFSRPALGAGLKFMVAALALTTLAPAISAQNSVDQQAPDRVDPGFLDDDAQSPSARSESSEPGELGNKSVEAAARIREIVQRIDPTAEFLPNGVSFRVESVPVTLVYDLNADRMRLISAVSSLGEVDNDMLLRLMQANFDSALDARYAIAQGALWSTFIHPLSSINDEDFVSGLGQTVNLVLTYGSSFASGGVVFGGGDSQVEQNQLIEELQDRTKEI